MRTSLTVGLVAAFALVVSTTGAQAALNLPTMQCSYSFSTSMGLGARGASVMDLQKVLNMYPETRVAVTGAGSAGMETSYYGPATMAAVKKFQAINSISPVSGYTGPLTRAVLNQVCSGTGVSLPVGCTTTSGFSPVTGVACNTGVSTTFPAGCTSALGFSSITGLACNGGVISQTGPIVASIAATNPASGVIVAGQATADLFHFTLSGNGVVNSLTLKRSGISDQNTLSNVYLYEGAARLTDGYSFNSTGDITINNLNLTVNGSKTLSVRADVYSLTPSGQTVAVWLTGLTSGATVSNVNLSGNTFAVASGSTLATASFSANTAAGTTVNAGTSAFSFFSAPLQVNTRTVWMKAANFRMIGSAPTDAIANIKMFVDGVDSGATGTVWASNGTNYVSFDFMAMPKSLTTGSHIIEVRGNVEKGSNRTVQFSIQNASDLMLMDPQVGVNIAVTGTIPNSGPTVTINTGSLTINNDPAFQAMTNITGGASNVAIARYKLHAYGEDVKIQTLTVSPVLGGSLAPTAGTLDDVTLYFNGSQVGTQQDLASSTLAYTLGSQLIVPAGVDSFLEVRANIRTSGGANYTAGTIRADLVVGSSNAQGQSSFNTVSTPAVTGNTLTIQTGLLNVAKNPGYANQSVTPNTANVKIGSFVFQNQSSSEGVRVTSLSVALGFTGSQVVTNLAALRTSETSGSGSTPVQPQATNTFSVDFTLAPGATKIIDIFADTGSITTGTVIATLTTTSIGSQSNVTQTVSSIAGQTITVAAGTVTNPPTLVTASATQAQYIAAGNGGAADGTKATFNFVSTGGAATITELKFTVTASLTATGTVSSIKVGNVTAPVVGGVAYLTGLSLPVSNSGSGLTQDVFISYSEVGTNGIVSATTSSVALTEVKYTSGGTTTTFNPSVSAPTMTLVGSKPTLTVNTATVSGLNLAAENKIGEVTIAADAKGNVKINDIQFAVGASNFTTLPTFTLARIADGSTTIAGSSCGQGTASSSSQTIFCEFGTTGNTFTTTTGTTNVESNTDYDGYTIAAGTSKTFSLYATVAAGNAGTGSATISTSVNAAGFNWDDTSYAVFNADGSNANPANGTNLTGTLIYNFPTGAYTVRQ